MSEDIRRRIGVASIVQETNTFSLKPSTLADFESQGLLIGEDAARALHGTNTEFAGALDQVTRRGATPVPLVRGWAMSSGRLESAALEALVDILRRQIRDAGPIDGLVLSLHGALVAVGVDSADAALLKAARQEVGPNVPIGVCLDLHANVTADLIAHSDVLVGYHTFPHIDQAATGARIADLLLDRVQGRALPVTAYAKRPLLIPAEAHQTTDGPMALLRKRGDEASQGRVLDVSLFPVQPWLDVAELGFAAVVTTDGDRELALRLTRDFADQVWEVRARFTVDLVDPVVALGRVRDSRPGPPFVLSESADSPTAGCAGDSPAMVDILLKHGRDLRSFVTLVDAPAVERCFAAGAGNEVSLRVGCSLDQRFHRPVTLEGKVERLGDGIVRLTGPVYTGMQVSMGRCAVVRSGMLQVLITEGPSSTFDPETFRSVGLNPEEADVIVVRSANSFHAGFDAVTRSAIILDLPGASTPRLESLRFERAPRPLYPIDAVEWAL